MSKKSKMISTIVVFVMILVMIPVAIFASRDMTANITNLVKFAVEDIEGGFYYAVAGSAIDNDKNKGYNCGWDENSGAISPKHLFTSVIIENPQNPADEITENALAPEFDKNNATLAIPKGVLFDETHQKISYYFIFANSAVEVAGVDDRSVNVSAKTDGTWAGGKPVGLQTSWDYCVLTQTATSFNSLNLAINTPDDLAWASGDDKTKIMEANGGVNVEPYDSVNGYSYIVMKYTLELKNTASTFDTRFTITINLKGNSVAPTT